MQLVLGLFAGASLFLSSILMNAAFPLDKRIANWLGVALLAFAQIVVGATVLSELHAISTGGFAVWHLLLLGFSLLLWWRKGKPGLRHNYLPDQIEGKAFIAQNIYLTVTGSILAIVIVLMILPTTFVDSDAAHYHVPRAHYWIQRASARHFYTDDIRQIERPPNASFLYMWQVLVSGSYSELDTVQWLAAILTAAAIAALARLLGHRWPAAIMASAIYLSLPTVALQMSMPWSDILSALLVVCFIYFSFEGVLDSGRSNSSARYIYVAYAGLAFGLMTGTKYTSLVVIPAVVVVLSLFVIWRFHENKKIIVAFAFACLVGFIVLGAYNYVLNTLEFGRPIGVGIPGFGRADSSPAQEAESKIDNRSISAELIRYVYQTMDWILVKPVPGADTLFALNNRAYRLIDDVLQLELDSVARFDFEELGMRPVRSGETGFGLLGYAVIIAAPAMTFLMLARSHRGTRFVLSASLLAIGVASIVMVALVRSWEPALVRYFAPSVGLLVAAIVPHIYSDRPRALTWLLPIGLIAIWTIYQTAASAQRLADQGRQLSSWQADILNDSLPMDAHIATIGRVEFVHVLEQFPEYRFEPVPEADLLPALLKGEFDAALVLDTEDTFNRYRLPLEHDQSWLVIDAKDILLRNIEPFGVELQAINGDAVLQVQGGRLIRRLGPDLVQLFVPVLEPLETASSSIMEINFPVAPPSDGALSVSCEGTQLKVQVIGSNLLAVIPQSTIAHDQAFLLCRLRITDQQFGLQIPSPSIDVSVYPGP